MLDEVGGDSGQSRKRHREPSDRPNEGTVVETSCVLTMVACCVLTRDGAGRVPSIASALALDSPLPSLPRASWNHPEPVLSRLAVRRWPSQREACRRLQ